MRGGGGGGGGGKEGEERREGQQVLNIKPHPSHLAENGVNDKDERELDERSADRVRTKGESSCSSEKMFHALTESTPPSIPLTNFNLLCGSLRSPLPLSLLPALTSVLFLKYHFLAAT